MVKNNAVNFMGHNFGMSTIAPNNILPIVLVAPIVDINQKHSSSVNPLSKPLSLMKRNGVKNPKEENNAFSINNEK